LTHIGGEGAAGIDYALLEIGGVLPSQIGVLVRDIGPAGSKISALRWDETAQV